MTKKKPSSVKGDCLIPARPPVGALRSALIDSSPYEEREIKDYFEWQSSKDPKGPTKVEHLELVKSEAAWGRVHKVWDVHATDGRWWVITSQQISTPKNTFLASTTRCHFTQALWPASLPVSRGECKPRTPSYSPPPIGAGSKQQKQ